MSTDAYQRARMSALVVALFFALGVSACGADSEGDAKPKPTAQQQGDTAQSKAGGSENVGDSTKRASAGRGTLTRADGTTIREWGDRRDNRRVVAIFTRMLDAFRAGDVARVCHNVDAFFLEQFTPGRSKPYSPCETKMTEFAESLERRRREPAELELLWVRSYGWVAGIWVEDRRGKRFRIPFTTLADGGSGGDGRWLMELGSYPYPEMLNATLVNRG